jgi:beta-galactosidase
VQSTIDQKLTLSLRLSLHGPGGIRSSLPEVKLEVPARGQASAAVDLPPLRAGRYLLGVIAVSERGTEAFGATTFQITSPASFDPVKLDQDFVEVGGTISGSAKLAAAAPPGTRLHVRLRDTFDRILAMQETDMAATPDAPVEFKLPVNEWATILMRAQAVLVDAQGDITQAEATFHVPRRRRGRFNFVMWEWPGTSPVGYYAGLHLRDRAGFTVVLSQSPSVPMAAACNMPCVPYTTRIQDTRNAEGIMEPICWNDDPAADAYVNEIADKYLPTRKQGVFVYSLGDEVATQGCCLSPACLRAYRRYLQEQYATIEALNRSWDSTYASFDDIDVLVKGDNYEKDAVQQGLFARWYDRQAFARHNMVNFCGRFHRAFQKRDPDAITGFEGSGGFGDDYDRILATNGFWTPYPSIGDEVLRSLAPRGYAHGIWSGYSRDPNPLIARNWRAITRGFDSIWWWRWDGAGRWRGYVSPNLDFWPATQQLTDEMRVVREGLGDLLIQCDMPHAGLAILYSLPSSLSSALEKSAEFGDYRAEHERWICAALDNQIPFRYVTAKQVREGVLGKAEFKLLILPFTQAVGPAEAKALSTFVEAGGTLVADIRPGVFDDHCKPQMPGALDDLFGIRRTGRASAKEISGRIEADLGGHKLSLDLDKTAADGDVALAAAKALATLDGVPLLTQRRMGKGMALLLNFRFPYNVKERHLATSDAARAFAAGIWASAGVSSPVRLRTKPGEPVRATEISRFTTGDVELLSVMPVAAADWSVVQELEIALAEDKDVYDLRSQKYLGRTREFAAAIQTGRATFFALLPYKAEQFAVSTDREAAAPGDTVTLALSLSNASGKGGTAAAFIEGTGPGGDALPYLRDVVLLRNGTGSYRFPIAYNQSPGTYRITARELFSGTAAETQCRVTR